MIAGIIAALVAGVVGIWLHRANKRRERQTEWYMRLVTELHFVSGKLQEYLHQTEQSREQRAREALGEVHARYNSLMEVLADRNVYGTSDDRRDLEKFIDQINKLGALSNTLNGMAVRNVQPTMVRALLKEVNDVAKRYSAVARKRF